MPPIVFDNVSKEYRRNGSQASLRNAISSLFQRSKHRQNEDEIFWALRNVSFTVESGEVMGIIGRNGAGKTTILKLLSNISMPTEGRVVTSGRISSLIELAAGFHPELTGRENIFLNGVILGLSRKEVHDRFDSIVEFSGLEQFLDMPVKHYSSGMWARLGFAIAAHVDPDILLIDEVLSVGDAPFQYRCFTRMQELVSLKKTVVFVSHNLDAVQHFCHRLIWLDHGTIAMIGRPGEVLRAYMNSTDLEKVGSTRGQRIHTDSPLRITQISLLDKDFCETNELVQGDDLLVRITYDTNVEMLDPHFSLGVVDGGTGLLFLATMLLDGQSPNAILGSGSVICRFHSAPLMPKVYQLWGEVRGKGGFGFYVPWQPFLSFRVVERSPNGRPHRAEVSLKHLRDGAPVDVPYEWIW